MSHNRQNKSATQLVFEQYTKFITIEFLNVYARSYDNQENVRNTWRNSYPYTDETAQFLIEKSKLFLRTFNTGTSKDTDPHFLNALTTLMADYLSLYTMRGDTALAAGKLRKAARNDAKAILKDTLYTNFSYIKNLFDRQKKQRQMRYAGRATRRYAEKAQKREQAQKDFEIASDVIGLFAMARQLGHKR